jgi:hypothetical protein
MRKEDELDYCIIADNQYIKGCNKSWARLLKKIYEVDPLICPKCGGDMRITGRDLHKVYINYTNGNIVTDFLPKIPYFFI